MGIIITNNKMKTFASYGSLRKGFWNHDRFGLGEPIETSEVYGEMYVRPQLGYPHLFETTNEKPLPKAMFYPVEIYEVEDNIYNHINNMEIGSGYYPKDVTFAKKDGTQIVATVWFAEADMAKSPDHFVEEYKKI